MNFFYFITFTLIIILNIGCNTKYDKITAKDFIISENPLHFGKMDFNTGWNVKTLSIKNVSQKKIKLTKFDNICGCINVEYDQIPILPEETKIIKIKYNTIFPGRFKKNIQLYLNNTPFSLTCIGNVIYKF